MARHKDEGKRNQAFKLYRKNTKLVDIAMELGVTQSLISQWKKEEDWDGKIETVQGLLRARLTRTESTENHIMVAEDMDQLQILRELENKVFDKVYSEEIVPTSWSDVISTLKYANDQRRLIKGQPTVKTETTLTIDVTGLNNDELESELQRTQAAIALLESGENKEES
jgi:transcriptional regulator with XRE-family HTH domain